MGGLQINTAFGYFKKMIEDAHRQPRAAPRLWCMCVFGELFLRGRQRAAKLKQSHRVIIFSPVCCGLLPNALSLLASSNKEWRCEKDKKEQASRRTNASIQKKSDVIGNIIFLHLCKVTMAQVHAGINKSCVSIQMQNKLCPYQFIFYSSWWTFTGH